MRPLVEWAEQEIRVPSGVYRGRRYAFHRHPCWRLYYGEVDGGRWRNHIAMGPTQSGKTFQAVALLAVYYLFERKEDVIIGIPDMRLAGSKWRKDILPVIQASRYAQYLPDTGQGAKGGDATMVMFRHGRSLTFLSGGGGDAARSGHTAPVILVTEADKLDVVGGTSKEGSKISQLRARSDQAERSGRRRFFAECTVSTEAGYVWSQRQHGSRTRIAIRCQACREYVTPEREDLVGWQDAPSVVHARELGAIQCPSCASLWTEDDRDAANADAILLHGDQTATPDGSVHGDPPDTDTLGFRYTAVNDPFTTMGAEAAREWEAKRAPDAEAADKAIRQFRWALPAKPAATDMTAVTVEGIASRMTADPRGVVPSRCGPMAVGIDIGKWRCHWVAIGWADGGGGHIHDYGMFEVAAQTLGEEKGLMVALRAFRDEVLEQGWRREDSEEPAVPALALVDEGWQTDVVRDFCRESGPRYIPSKGLGGGSGAGSYHHPSDDGKRRAAGLATRYHLVRTPKGPALHFDADHWKGYFRSRLEVPVDQPGALTLFAGTPHQHMTLGRHVVAEKRYEEFVPGKGTVTKWRQDSRDNHYGDAGVLACVAGHRLGIRILSGAPATGAAGQKQRGYKRADDDDRAWKIGR